MSPTRRQVLESAGLLALASILPGRRVDLTRRALAEGATQPSARPNIVVILTDDLDSRLNSLDYMPLLRQHVAERGVSFTHCVANTPLCMPSRVSILRGQHTHNHRIYTNPSPLGGYDKVVATGLESSTLATALHDSGYHTVYVGKYLNEYPLAGAETAVPPGWDEWVCPAQGNASTPYDYTLNVNGVLVPHGSAPEDYITDVYADHANRSIVAGCARGEPFFVMLAPHAPHNPADPAPRHAQMFADLAAPQTPSFNEADVSDKHAGVAELTLVKPVGIERMGQLYRQRLRSLQAVDEAVARIVESLELAGALGNTYILFASDNGFHMGQHRLREGKRMPYEEDLIVPFMVRGPGVPAGLTTDALACLTDITPTVLQLAAVAAPDYVDGRSLVPLLLGDDHGEARQAVLAEAYPWNTAVPSLSQRAENRLAEGNPQGTIWAVLQGSEFKYTEFWTGEREYYDLVNDPFELDNHYDRLSVATKVWLHRWLGDLKTSAGQDCVALESRPPVGPMAWLPEVSGR